MDAVEFLKERSRMCKYYMTKGPCYTNECPMYRLRCRLSDDGPRKVICSSVLYKLPEEAVAIVENWSKEHPVKTRLTDFLEKHPNADLGVDGEPVVCAKVIGYVPECMYKCGGVGACKKCWDTPLEEDNK